jgi:predicted anti-sigma-YlaC factor YlaD
MMNCKQATQLMSEKLDRPLQTKEKVALGIHTTMCAPCRQFGLQMEELRDISKLYVNGKTDQEK